MIKVFNTLPGMNEYIADSSKDDKEHEYLIGSKRFWDLDEVETTEYGAGWEFKCAAYVTVNTEDYDKDVITSPTRDLVKALANFFFSTISVQLSECKAATYIMCDDNNKMPSNLEEYGIPAHTEIKLLYYVFRRAIKPPPSVE
jgi:hypothetical protein